MKVTLLEKQKLERAIRTIRQRMFDLPEHKQASATEAIRKLHDRIGYKPYSPHYHWMYAGE